MRSKKQGAILIFTLAILTAIVSVLVAATITQRIATMSAGNRINHARAEIAAESGLQTALSILATQNANTTSPNDAWFSLGTNGSDRFLTDDGSFRIQILDAGSLVNLNNATTAQLQNLPLTQAQIDSLLDWVQTGAQPRADGAKDDFYNSLPNPYNAAQSPLHSVDELLLINNFTPATLFTVQPTTSGNSLSQQTLGNNSYQPTLYDLVTVDSKSSNSTSTGTALTNINTASQGQIQNALTTGGVNARTAQAIATAINTQKTRTPYTTLGAVLRVNGVNTQVAAAILNAFTVSTTPPTGKIDLNTAPLTVLETIPGVTPDIAQAIVSQQQAGFTTLGQITQVPGMSIGVLRQVADSFTINSQAFLVRVIGTAGSVSVPLEAVITLTPPAATGGAGAGAATAATTTTTTSTTPSASLGKIYHPPFNNMTSHWHWDTTTTKDIDLRTGNS